MELTPVCAAINLVSIKMYADNKWYWFVSKDLTGNEEDSKCWSFPSYSECLADLTRFLADSHIGE